MLSKDWKFRIVLMAVMWILYFALVPLHEGVHWVEFKLDPHREPVSIEVFNWSKIVSSNRWGQVFYKEEYEGAFNDEWEHTSAVYEVIAYVVEGAVAAILALWLVLPYRDVINGSDKMRCSNCGSKLYDHGEGLYYCRTCKEMKELC